MRQIVRSTLTALMAASGLVLLPVAVHAQQPPKGTASGKAGTGKAAPAAPRISPAELAKREEILATVNGDTITRARLLMLLSQYSIAPGTEKATYATAMDLLVNGKLLTQFLNANRVQLDEAEVDRIIDLRRKSLLADGASLENALAEANMTIDQVKAEIRETRQWAAFVDKMATDSALADYMKANPDVFNGTAVRASHIQLNLEESAPAAEKQKAKDKLLAIKKEILAGKITFADAANKYSEDPAIKEQPSGGDLKWFPRTKFPEAFSAAAFALKKGEISDPVESDWGVHLIQVTDRREGKMPSLEEIREKAKNQYAMTEQNRIVTELRKKAKIDIKPMPADLFGPAPAAAPAPKPAADAKAKS